MKITESISEWALSYYINGNPIGLNTEEIAMIDQWMPDWQVEIISPITDEEGNHYPFSPTIRCSDIRPRLRNVT